MTHLRRARITLRTIAVVLAALLCVTASAAAAERRSLAGDAMPPRFDGPTTFERAIHPPSFAPAIVGNGFTTYEPLADYPALRTRSSYVLRLVATTHGNVETARSAVAIAAQEVAAAGGPAITVAPGTVPDAPGIEPGTGEILLSVEDVTPCGAEAAGCGGPWFAPRNRDRATVVTKGQIWLWNGALSYTARSLNHLVAHELGHALGLDHHDESYAGQVQVMHSTSYDAERYRTGDRNGIAYLGQPEGEPVQLIEMLYGTQSWLAKEITNTAPQLPAVAGSPAAISLDGGSRVYSRGPNGHLYETRNDWIGGREWNATDLTALAGPAATIAADPAVVVMDGLPRVYAVNANGHLLEFVYGNGTWGAYDMTIDAGAPPVRGRPAVTMLNGYPRIYARGADGHLVEFSWSGQGGRGWAWSDLTSATSGPAVAGDPSVILIGGNPRVLYRTTGSRLFETYYGDGGPGVGWHWNNSDLTGATGGPFLAGDPTAIMVGGAPHVYAVSESRKLIEVTYGRGPAGWGWSWYDLSSGTPMTTLAAGRPAAVVHDGAPRIYTRSADRHIWETVYGQAPTGTWGYTSYDLTSAAGRSTAYGDPAAIELNGPRIYVRGAFP